MILYEKEKQNEKANAQTADGVASAPCAGGDAVARHGMTALAVEDGGEGTGPPAVEVVEPEGGNSGSDETVGTPLLPRAGDKNAAHNKSFR